MTEYGRIHTDGSRSGGQPAVDREPIGLKNGRLMAQHDCYTLESNPYHAGTKAHADFVTAFTAVRTERLCNELDITNADHIALWLERNMEPSAISYLAVKIVEAHEAALRQPTQSDALREALAQIAFSGADGPYGEFGEALNEHQMRRVAKAALKEQSK